MKKLEKISEETIHENPWWKYKHDEYELPSGEVGNYYYADTKDFVVTVPVLNKEKLVLVKQYRYLSERFSIGFPAGYHDSNSIESSAVKELKQESGYIPDRIEKLGDFDSSPGTIKNTVNVFLAHVSQQDKQNLDKEEDIEVLEKTPTEFQKLIENNKIFHGESLGAWTMAIPKLKKEVNNFNI